MDDTNNNSSENMKNNGNIGNISDALSHLRMELKGLHEQDVRLLRQLLSINHTINMLTGTRNPYKRSHSSSSMSHHRHSTGLLLKCPSYVNHQGTPPTSPVSPTDPAQFHHLQVPPGNQTLPTNVSSVRAHMPLIRYRSEPLRDEEPLSPDGSMPPSESSLGDTQGSEYLASSFSSYNMDSEGNLDNLSPDAEYELNDMLAPLPRAGSQRWRKSPTIEDNITDKNAARVNVGLDNGVIKSDDSETDKFSDAALTVPKRFRPPLQHSPLAIVLDDNNLPQSPTKSNDTNHREYTTNINNLAPVSRSLDMDNYIIIPTPPTTPKIELSKHDMTQYEMSYEQFLEKGIQVWKDVQHQRRNSGVVDERTMSALTIVM